MRHIIVLGLILILGALTAQEKSNYQGVSLQNRKFEGSYKYSNFSHSTLNFLTFDHTNVAHANFSRAALQNVRFISTNLADAQFLGAGINRSSFINTTLTNANFSKSFISSSTFAGSNLTSANFSQAYFWKPFNLLSISFENTVLDNAQFREARLQPSTSLPYHGTATRLGRKIVELIALPARPFFQGPWITFKGASLKNADFSDALLKDIDLSYLSLEGAKFTRADLGQEKGWIGTIAPVNFTGANLTNADFSYANVQGVNFTNAILTGANFTHANVCKAIFTGAQGVMITNAKTCP